MSSQPSDTVHLALVASDDAIGSYRRDDRTATLKALDAYVAAIDKLQDTRIQLIVLPENISRVAPQWREDVWARIRALADRTHATVVAGFNTYVDDAQRNISTSVGATPSMMSLAMSSVGCVLCSALAP